MAEPNDLFNILKRMPNILVGAGLLAVSGILVYYYTPLLPDAWTAGKIAIAFVLLLIAAAALLAGATMLISRGPRATGRPYEGRVLVVLILAGFFGALGSSILLAGFLEARVASLADRPGLSITRFVLQERMLIGPNIGAGEAPDEVSEKFSCILKDFYAHPQVSVDAQSTPGDANAGEEKLTSTCKDAEGYFAKEFLESFISEKSLRYWNEAEYRNIMIDFVPDVTESKEILHELTVGQELCRAVIDTKRNNGGTAVDFLGKELETDVVDSAESRMKACNEAPASDAAISRYLAPPEFDVAFGSSELPLWRLLTHPGSSKKGMTDFPARAYVYGKELNLKGEDFDAQKKAFEARYGLIDALNRQFRELSSPYSAVGNLFLGWVQLLVYTLFIAGTAQLLMIVQAQSSGIGGHWRDRNLGKENPFEYLGNVRLAFASYIDANIPRLGFIGTVLGISAALGTAHRIVDPQLSPVEQADQIQVVVGLLGVAFNTTFVALVLGVLFDVGFRFVISREVANVPGDEAGRR